MLKSIQIKIVMIFTILGIIVITALGLFCLYKFDNITQIVLLDNTEAQNITEQIKIAIYSALGVFTVFAVILSFFVAKVVLSPISKLVKSAEMISHSKKYLGDGKNKTEFDDLANAFGVMNYELQENLNEATRQKKQIETILLHMTDGIIAFNIEGK